MEQLTIKMQLTRTKHEALTHQVSFVQSAFLLLEKYHKLGCTLPVQRRTGGTSVEL